MDIKKELNKVYYLQKKIDSIIDNISYYETMSHAIPGQDFSRERVDGTRNLDAPFVKWIYKKIEAEEKLHELENQMTKTKVEVMLIIEKLENIEQKHVLACRYIEL